MEKFITINFEGKNYQIKKENLDFIISTLEHNPNNTYSNEEILSLMEKYELFDIDFLNNINNLL